MPIKSFMFCCCFLFVCFCQSFQRLHEPEMDSLTSMVTSTPNKAPGHHSNGGGVEEVFECEPALDETEMAWREVVDRLDPLGTLTT